MQLLIKSLAIGLALLLLSGMSLLAAPTAEHRAEILAAGTLLTKAGNLYKENKFAEAGEVVKEVQARLEKLIEGGDEQTLAQVQPMHRRLANAHALLGEKGVKLPELKPLEVKKLASKPAAGKTGAKQGTATVSFTKDVAPILNERCGRCHVRNARGMFSMATYESLMRGPAMSGKVIFPGDAKGSVLIEKVQDKEMPPSGVGIPDSELSILKKWVEEGAKFDGKDPAAQLVSFLPAGSQTAQTPAPAVQTATGSETISFARDIAPVLIQNCTRCHGGDNPRGDLNLTTIASLYRGGMRGEPVLPGKPADSLLVKKLKGIGEGARMPMGRPPLDDATIAKIEKWIAEGAKFDGPNTNQPITEVAALAKAAASSHEQLSADRAALAVENWRLGMPGMPPNRSESTNFLVLGSVGENTLAEIAQKAEALAPKVAEVFRAPRDHPLVKGRMTLYVFGERYDYSEFCKMVEKRDVPPAWRGHYRYSVVDAYGAVLVPKSGDYSLDALVAQQLAAIYLKALGKGVPHWFAEGCGRVVASRLAPRLDARVDAWDEELPSAMAAMAKPDDFLTGKLATEQADVCSFSFAKFLMSDAKRFQPLLDGLRKGGEFAKTFADAYGGTPAQVSAVWARSAQKGKRGK